MQESGKSRRGPAVLIAGPTASGKSALALKIATATDGIIVNVDSMQVYSILELLTARPRGEALQAAPHRLYGHVHPSRQYSAGAWLADVRALLADPETDRRMLVFVGGTGLYFRALMGGLADMPAIPEAIRQELRAELAEKGDLSMHRRLAEVDPRAARSIRPADSQRILRALEVWAATGRPISEYQERRSPPLLDPQDSACYIIEPDRARLTDRIEARFRRMVEEGAIEEARRLAALDLDKDLPATKAIGLRQLRDLDAGRIGLEEAILQAVIATRRYAKRQATWFRHQAGPEWKRIGMEEKHWPDAIALDHGAEAS